MSIGWTLSQDFWNSSSKDQTSCIGLNYIDTFRDLAYGHF